MKPDRLTIWIMALGWCTLMLIVWTLFRPRAVSVTTFVLLASTGLLLAVYGAVLRNGSRHAYSADQARFDLLSAAPAHTAAPTK
jgi:hypothetical protein